MQFEYHPLFEQTPVKTEYRKLDIGGVHTESFNGEDLLIVSQDTIRQLTEAALTDVSHLLRPSHLKQLSSIFDDPDASDNDRFVAKQLLLNANIAANMVLPSCQDTGTAIVMGKRGHRVWTDGNDESSIYEGVFNTYTSRNLRYSQLAPITTYKETNTKCNLPAQVDLLMKKGDAYEFLFVTKGGGSANKTYLFQQTKALLNPKSMMKFLDEKIRTFQADASKEAGIFHHLITLPTYHTAALSTDNLAKEYFGDQGMLGYVAGVQRKEIRQSIACVKHQNMAGSDMGDDHKEYFAGEAALKASGKDNTMNQF